MESKKEWQSPEMVVIRYEEDIIRTSGVEWNGEWSEALENQERGNF